MKNYKLNLNLMLQLCWMTQKLSDISLCSFGITLNIKSILYTGFELSRTIKAFNKDLFDSMRISEVPLNK
ncbi:hypothetical protein BpHYR1_042976 [Brachionus plicatilis]|uniref:Uncharacterized protein n=1 Tax=Brachionus plicatilis TaxID=10195 RepID=A0A3M7P678_BRAPC|nr:hypothetical protein BpHYR1_042976 [Brachionus plicatilis]